MSDRYYSGYGNYEIRPKFEQQTEQHDTDSAEDLTETVGCNYVQYELEGGSGPRSKAEREVDTKVRSMEEVIHTADSKDMYHDAEDRDPFPRNY